MAANPNFPENLAILPSRRPDSAPRPLGTNPNSELEVRRRKQIESSFDASSQERAIQQYGIAGRVWEAAYPLLVYLDNPREWEFDPPCSMNCTRHESSVTVLELGSGMGIVGIKTADVLSALHQGQEENLVILTDLPEVCSLIKEKVDRRSREAGLLSISRLWVRPLSWGCHEHAAQLAKELRFEGTSSPRYLTHIVCSDLVYFPELLAPLLRSLIELSSQPFVFPPDTSTNHVLEVIISYKIRSLSKETPFWQAFGLWFAFHPVLVRRRTDNPTRASASWRRFGATDTISEGPTFVFIARRRPQSYAWRVPERDTDLLNGVGAGGTDTKKADDTFETLLLMSLEDDEYDGDIQS